MIRRYSRAMKTSIVSALIMAVGVGGYGVTANRASEAAVNGTEAVVDFGSVAQRIEPAAIGVGSSTYGANPLSSPAQRDAERQLDARYIRLPVGYRNGRVTSSAAGGPTDLDVPALVRLYQSWGYRVIAVIGGRTNDFDVQPGDATQIIRALGTGGGIDYSAPNEPGNQGKTVQDEIAMARMIVSEGKAIDPGFKIWGPVWAWYSRGDLKTFAAAMGNDLAGIDYHHYGMGSTSLTTAYAMSETPSFAREIGEVKADLASLGLGDAPVNIDELNFSWRYEDGTPGGNNRFFTTINTVWIASSLGHILSAGGRGLPYASQNGPLGVMVEAGGVNPDNRPPSSPMPAYWGIAAWTGGGLWPHYGDTMYRSTVSDTLREVYAVKNEAGGYNVIAINKSETEDAPLSLKLQGVPDGAYSVRQTNALNPYDAPVMIASGQYKAAVATQLQLPRMSVSIITIQPGGTATPPASPGTPPAAGVTSDITGDGKVNMADMSALFSDWGTGKARSDLNGSGKVDVGDMSLLMIAWKP